MFSRRTHPERKRILTNTSEILTATKHHGNNSGHTTLDFLENIDQLLARMQTLQTVQRQQTPAKDNATTTSSPQKRTEKSSTA